MDDSAEERTGPAPRRARGPRRRASVAGLLVVPVLCGGAVGTVFRGTDRAAVALTGSSSALATAANIPLTYLLLYQQAASTCTGLRWEFLAAVGRLESDHGRAKAVGVASGENAWGAGGPMQFLAGTWKQYGTPDPNDRYDPAKAVPAAARFLCAIGAGKSEFRGASNYYAGPYATGKGRVAGDAYAARVVKQADAYAAIAARFGSSSSPQPPTATTSVTTTPTTVAGRPPTATTQAVKPKATTTTAKAPVAPRPTAPATTAAPAPPPATTGSRKKIPPASVSGYVVKAKP